MKALELGDDGPVELPRLGAVTRNAGTEEGLTHATTVRIAVDATLPGERFLWIFWVFWSSCRVDFSAHTSERITASGLCGAPEVFNIIGFGGGCAAFCAVLGTWHFKNRKVMDLMVDDPTVVNFAAADFIVCTTGCVRSVTFSFREGARGVARPMRCCAPSAPFSLT